MKQKIKVKVITPGCMPVVNDKGNAFDLRAAEDIVLKGPHAMREHQVDNVKVRDVKFESTIIPLGIAIELPKGFIANIRPRSSMFKKWKIIQSNSVGLVDETYCGDTDQWGLPVIAFSSSHITKGDRLCQFEIIPSQTATFWQKIKWLFTTKYVFVEVDTLSNEPRGGFGSTGVN